jgi:hypothetical protein
MIGGVVQAMCRNGGEGLLQVGLVDEAGLWPEILSLCAESLAWSAELVADT